MSHASSHSRAPSHSRSEASPTRSVDEEDGRAPMDVLVGMFDELGVPPAPRDPALPPQAEPGHDAPRAGEAEPGHHTGPLPEPSVPPGPLGRAPYPPSPPPTQEFDDAASIGAASVGTAASLGSGAGSLASGRAAASLVRGDPPPWVQYPSYWPRPGFVQVPEMQGNIGPHGGGLPASAADGHPGQPPGVPAPQPQQGPPLQQHHPQGSGGPAPSTAPPQEPRPVPPGPGRLDPSAYAPYQGGQASFDSSGVPSATGIQATGVPATPGIAGAPPPSGPPGFVHPAANPFPRVPGSF